MGCNQSVIYDLQGNELTNRHCIILVIPPSFQVSRYQVKQYFYRFLESFPQDFPYKYISVGKLIRDEINKKTNYSNIILNNLEKHHKINDTILQILLKNTALQGNFMIKFSPKDQNQIQVWKQFISNIIVDLIIILKHNPEQIIKQQTRPQLFLEKVKEHNKDIKNIRSMFDRNIIKELQDSAQVSQEIVQIINKKNSK